jgi:ABC-2 type transport system permease protein
MNVNLNMPGATTADSAPAAITPVQQSMARVYGTLIRRELWEHRSLWITPLIVAALMTLTAFPIHLGNLDPEANSAKFFTPENRLGWFTLMIWAQTLPQYLIMSIVATFYLMDCLYAERKDRSILFWKSLPVSDATTVLSKLLVGLVVLPLGVYLLAMVSGVLFQVIWSARVAAGSLPDIAVGWNTVAWLKVQGLMLFALIVCILWFAPLAAILILVSAWVRKNVFLWTSLPPVIAIIVERIAFGTHHISRLLEYRTWGIWGALGVNPTPPEGVGHGRVVSLADLFDNVEMGKAFLNIDLWLGLAVAAALVFAAIRIRRYRDDT